jgi:hypothetical protein
MIENAAGIVATYFDSWRAGDFAALRAVLADDINALGPLSRTDRAEAHWQEIVRLSQIMTDLVVQESFVEGLDVLTWFELHTRVTPSIPIAHWSHIENGKLTRIHMVFDGRPFSAIGWTDPAGRPARRCSREREILSRDIPLTTPDRP